MTSSAHPWLRETFEKGTRYRCTRHKRTFALTETCSECDGSPGPRLARAPRQLPRPPQGCMSSVQLERWFVALAKQSAAAADGLDAAYPLPDPETGKSAAIVVVDVTAGVTVNLRDFHTEGAIVKHREIAIRAMRAATELAREREDQHLVEERDRELVERESNH